MIIVDVMRARKTTTVERMPRTPAPLMTRAQDSGACTASDTQDATRALAVARLAQTPCMVIMRTPCTRTRIAPHATRATRATHRIAWMAPLLGQKRRWHEGMLGMQNRTSHMAGSMAALGACGMLSACYVNTEHKHPYYLYT